MDGYVIGSFLNKLRKQKGLKQKEVADAIQVSDKAVSRWETGKGIPDVDSLQSLSDFYEVSINEILAGRYLRDDEIKEISDSNLWQMGKKASDTKKRFLTVMMATLVLFILLAAISLYSPSTQPSEIRVLGNVIEEKLVFFTSGTSAKYVSCNAFTDRTLMGGVLMASTQTFEYSASDMDTFFLDVAALDRAELKYTITVVPDEEPITISNIILYEYSGSMEDYEFNIEDVKKLPYRLRKRIN